MTRDTMPHDLEYELGVSFDVQQRGRSLMWYFVEPGKYPVPPPVGNYAGEINLPRGARIRVTVTGYSEHEWQASDLKLRQAMMVTVPHRRPSGDHEFRPSPFHIVDSDLDHDQPLFDLCHVPGFDPPDWTGRTTINGTCCTRWIFRTRMPLAIPRRESFYGIWDLSMIVTAKLAGSRPRVFRFDPEVEVGNGSHSTHPDAAYRQRIR